MNKVGLHRLIDKITSNAMMESVISSSSRANGEKHRPLSPSDMPGYRIQQLYPEEREALSHATAKDFSWRGFR